MIQFRVALAKIRPPSLAGAQGAVSKHNSNDNRFSARADSPRGGVVAALATQGGRFCTLYDPPGGQGRGGLASGKDCGEPVASSEVFDMAPNCVRIIP
jgi:hypothetical protein